MTLYTGEIMSSGVGTTPTDQDNEALKIYVELPEVLARNFPNNVDSSAMYMALDMYIRNLKFKMENPNAN